ncbi:MAG: YerC/YecD family TrpR-related protein [Patescibacteria group bacterium]
MSDSKTTIWQSESAQQLVEALLSINSGSDMQNFLRDVMTEKEIIEVSARLEAARMLKTGSKYIEIVAKTKLSSRTVARISDWMQNGCGGYEPVLTKLSTHHNHIPPARAV